MTTPEQPGGRVRRKPPQRGGPDRSGASSRPAPADAVSKEDVHIDEAVADAVKTAYSVLSDTIEQGRRSAESFRHGQYNYRDVPVDVRLLAANMLRLAKQLSESTFEIVEALLAQQGPGFPMPPPGVGPVPPFRPFEDIVAGQADAPKPAQAHGGHAGMRLSVNFVGAPGAKAHGSHLARPHQPTSPHDLSVGALTSRDGKASLSGITFDADLANGGLIATVTVPQGQPAGVYSGAVYAPGQDLPLGLLVVELPKQAQTGA